MGQKVEPELDRKIGNFTFLRTLGEGGMGKVFLARQVNLDRLVAIKILHQDLAHDDVFVERFQREAKAAAVFQHPNVVNVIDAGQDPESGDQYIAFEYVEGHSLERLVQLKPLDEQRTLEIIYGVAKALMYAESKGIVHRDVKPDNILLAEDGTPKLADLGLAKTHDARAPKVTQTGMIVGTPLYMAPEQALGYEEVDIRADIYALGLCVWRMLTGTVPYDQSGESSSLQILSRHINEDLPDLRSGCPKASESMAGLVRTMSARHRDDRYRSAKELVADLESLLKGEPPAGIRPAKPLPDEGNSKRGKTTLVETRKAKRSPDKGQDKKPRKLGKDSEPSWAPTAAAPSDGGGPPKVLLGVGAVGVILASLLGFALFSGGENGVDTGSVGTEPVEPHATSQPVQPDTPGNGSDPSGSETTPEDFAAGPPSGLDLEDQAAMAEQVTKTGELLLSSVSRGRSELRRIKRTRGWQKNEALRRFVVAMDSVLSVMDPATPPGKRRDALFNLRRMVAEQRRAPLPGKLAHAVDTELMAWLAWSTQLEPLRLSLGDPRNRQLILQNLKDGVPQRAAAEAHASAVMELADTLDLYDNWVMFPKRRVLVARRRIKLMGALAGSATEFALEDEIKVMDHVLNTVLHDRQRCLLDAIGQVRASKTSFIKTRLREVPGRAATSNMRARAIELELGDPWKRDQHATVSVAGVTCRFDRLGVEVAGRQKVAWGTPPRMILEPRQRDILLRLPGSKPREFTLDVANMKSKHRFTVRTSADLDLARVTLLRLPDRKGQAPRRIKGSPLNEWAGK